MSAFGKKISQFWEIIQGTLFPWLERELDPLTENQMKPIAILEVIQIENALSAKNWRENWEE